MPIIRPARIEPHIKEDGTKLQSNAKTASTAFFNAKMFANIHRRRKQNQKDSADLTHYIEKNLNVHPQP
jgi:hypothetical protein